MRARKLVERHTVPGVAFSPGSKLPVSYHQNSVRPQVESLVVGVVKLRTTTYLNDLHLLILLTLPAPTWEREGLGRSQSPVSGGDLCEDPR